MVTGRGGVVRQDDAVTRVVIVGGGPGGYEAALVAAQFGADVTVVERDGLGGACVLTDCVPSKTLIATADVMADVDSADRVGVRVPAGTGLDLAAVEHRVRALARAQSADVETRLRREGVSVVEGAGCLRGPGRVTVGDDELEADVVLIATGATPRVVAGLECDGSRILTWRDVYSLETVPEHLVVVGSGVTGAEFASAYRLLGAEVTLVSSRDRVLPGEDADAAAVIEDVFGRGGMTVLSRSRAASARVVGDEVVVTLTDGREVTGSHCLIAVGSVPNTAGLGLESAGVRLRDGGFVDVDRVSRTSVPSVYAAGDCTGVLMLASVAAMQGRIAMWHALGEAVAPLRLSTVAANVFTTPEIATVGISQEAAESSAVSARVVKLPLATNARAKMQGIDDGFVKLFATSTGIVLGGVVVAPRASELVLPVSMAVQLGLSVDQLAHSFAVYPSLSGSLTEAARQLMEHSPG
jgi:pyruvate/2-oxoglutarate dehydrogenase complex dihydrolipoamide dehydrogenase (E3) component